MNSEFNFPIFIFLLIIELTVVNSYGLSDFSTNTLNDGESIKKIININENITYLFTNNKLYSINENNSLSIISNNFEILNSKYSDIYTISKNQILIACTDNNLLNLVNENGENQKSYSYKINNLTLKNPNTPCSINYNSNNNIILISYSYYDSTAKTIDYYLLKFTFDKNKNSFEFSSKLNTIQNDFTLSNNEMSELIWSFFSCDFFDDDNIFCVFRRNNQRLKYMLLELNELKIKDKDYLSSSSITEFKIIKLSNKLISICGGDGSNYIILGVYFDIDKKKISYISKIANGYLYSYSIKTLAFSKSDNYHIYAVINYGIPIIFRYIFTPNPTEMSSSEIEIDTSFSSDSYYLISVTENNFKIILQDLNNKKFYISTLTLPKQIPLLSESNEINLSSEQSISINLKEIINFTNLTSSQLETFNFINQKSIYYGNLQYSSNDYSIKYKSPSNGNYYFEFIYKEDNYSCDSFIIPIKICYESCGSCNEYSNNFSDMKCTSCESNYFPLFNNSNQCYLSYEQINYFYYNYSEGLFKKCNEKCIKCANEATNESDNCITCNDKYYYDNINHNCIECNTNKYKWYVDIDNNNKVCLNGNDCPDNYPKLLQNNNECVIKCPDEIYDEKENNICVYIGRNNTEEKENEEEEIKENENEEDDNENEIENNNNKENILRNAENNILDYYNRKITITQGNIELRVLKAVSSEISNEKINEDGTIKSISKINLLKDNFNKITSKINSTSFYVLEVNVKNKNGLTDQIEYGFYDLNGEKIRIDNILNNDSYIIISNTINHKNKLIAENIYEYNNEYDSLNYSNKFYYDVCSKFSDLNNNDVIIEDRRKYFYQSNLKFCESDYCSFFSYDYENRIVNCLCKIKTEINLSENDFDYIYPKFENNNKYKNENFRILKCKKEGNKNIGKNPGFWIVFILFIFEFFIILSLMINTQKITRNISNPPKNEGIINNINEKNTENNIEILTDSINKSKKGNSETIVNTENEKLNSNEKPSFDIKNEQNKSFIDIYVSFIKKSELILFTFIDKDNYIKQVKISLFILILAFIILFSLFFQNNNRISHIFLNNSNSYDFFYSLPYIIYVIVITNIINFILKFIFLYNNKSNNISIIRILCIIELIIIIFLWIHTTFFCEIFSNTQKHLFLDSLFAFIILCLFSFVSCILYSIIKLLGIKYKNKKLCYLSDKVIEF